ncbi:MAG: N-acetyl sugar amidotransferase [Planctomycetota bacterium]
MLRVCTRCVSDTTIPGIRFDDRGVCNYCDVHDEMEQRYPQGKAGELILEQKVEAMKRRGRGRDYDIIVGVSGGRDSSYALDRVVKLGLRPLAVHFDNGWNSEIAVSNIKTLTEKLNVDLHTHVADWEEFKELQLSFLRASTSDAEIPTDVAIHATLHKVAAQEKIRSLVFAHSFRTEGVMPIGWTYMDGRYIKHVQRRFGKRRLKTVPNFYMKDLFYHTFFQRIEALPILNYLPYNQKKIDKYLTEELGWRYSGGHHHESYYTHFFQSYYLPKKFGIDKRKIEFSALVRSGQVERDYALAELEACEYPYEEELVEYVIQKLGLSQGEFEEIMQAKPKSFRDYPTYYPWLRLFHWPIKLAAQGNLIPRLLYLKFFG